MPSLPPPPLHHDCSDRTSPTAPNWERWGRFLSLRSFSPSVGDRDPVQACPHFPAGEDALTCAPAPQQLFVFCLHLFTHPAQGVDTLHNKGEGLGVKTGTFRVKSGGYRPITPLFSTDLPSPQKKITFTRLFSASKLENGHLAQGKASKARKRRPYTTVIQVLNQHKCLSNLSRCAAIFRSSYQPFHRTALRKTRQRRQARGVKVKTQKSSPLTISETTDCTRWVKE